jgi:hypothetical protein
MIALPGGLSSTLDALKVADTTLFLVSACQQNGIDAVGEKILIACLAHGLPSTVVAVVDLDSLPLAVRISLIHPTNHCLEEDRLITGFVEIPIVLILFFYRQYKLIKVKVKLSRNRPWRPIGL